MRKRDRIRVIDTHTEGEPTRILIRDRLPDGCRNAVESRDEFRNGDENIRTAILQEPRGHRDQFGSVVSPSVDENTDFTIFFTTPTGYLDMCAHATIGTSTALVFSGNVKAEEPETRISYDTPAGKVSASVAIKDGEAESVSLVNVPSFYLGRKVVQAGEPLNRKVNVDVAFGGNFYAIVDSAELDLEVEKEFIEELRDAGTAICKAVYEQVHPEHPENPGISAWPLAMITGRPRISESNYRNIVVFPNGSFDRSPCGTGTSARASALVSKGVLKVGDSFTHESITNTTFDCTIKGRTRVGKYDAVIPVVTGSAWITQVSEIIIDETDPLKNGFLIG